jgi:hypothetical protein
MRNIIIVDSPGINVAGKIGNITNEYIVKADSTTGNIEYKQTNEKKSFSRCQPKLLD